MPPLWSPCPCCENFWCNLHQMHAHDCPCPPVEKMPADPYYGDATMPIRKTYCMVVKESGTGKRIGRTVPMARFEAALKAFQFNKFNPDHTWNAQKADVEHLADCADLRVQF